MLTPATGQKRSAWSWIPSLYFAEGLPYVTVMIVSVIMYKNLGVSNTEIAFYTSWLYLPWVIKPFWSPMVDIVKTKRSWIIAMQLLTGAGLGGVAMTIPADNFFRYSLAFMWLLAFSSATHDIAAVDDKARREVVELSDKRGVDFCAVHLLLRAAAKVLWGIRIKVCVCDERKLKSH